MTGLEDNSAPQAPVITMKDLIKASSPALSGADRRLCSTPPRDMSPPFQEGQTMYGPTSPTYGVDTECTPQPSPQPPSQGSGYNAPTPPRDGSASPALLSPTREAKTPESVYQEYAELNGTTANPVDGAPDTWTCEGTGETRSWDECCPNGYTYEECECLPAKKSKTTKRNKCKAAAPTEGATEGASPAKKSKTTKRNKRKAAAPTEGATEGASPAKRAKNTTLCIRIPVGKLNDAMSHEYIGLAKSGGFRDATCTRKISTCLLYTSDAADE